MAETIHWLESQKVEAVREIAKRGAALFLVLRNKSIHTLGPNHRVYGLLTAFMEDQKREDC